MKNKKNEQKQITISTQKKKNHEEKNRRVCDFASHVLAEMQESQHKRNPLYL